MQILCAKADRLSAISSAGGPDAGCPTAVAGPWRRGSGAPPPPRPRLGTRRGARAERAERKTRGARTPSGKRAELARPAPRLPPEALVSRRLRAEGRTAALRLAAEDIEFWHVQRYVEGTLISTRLESVSVSWWESPSFETGCLLFGALRVASPWKCTKPLVLSGPTWVTSKCRDMRGAAWGSGWGAGF